MTLFGLPFFGVGIFLLFMALGLVPISNASDVPWWGWPLIFLMGIVFAVVGGGLAFRREWIAIDKGRGRIDKSQGLLVPMRREELRLSDYRSVAIRWESGDSDTPESFPVVLAGKNGKDISLYSSSQYAESQNRAAYLARVLSLPLEDASSPHTKIRPPEELDVSFQSRLAASIDQDEHVSRPMQMRSEISRMNGATQITIIGRWSRRRTVVTVNRSGLVLNEQSVFGQKRTEIPVRQIIDIDYGIAEGGFDQFQQQMMQKLPPNKQAEAQAAIASGQLRIARSISNALARSKGIIIKSEQGITTFGEGLPDDEVRYLYWVVKKGLTPL